MSHSKTGRAAASGADAPAGAAPPALHLDGVAVARGGRQIWSDGTFDVPAGGVVAIIGPNGSGKSTLLQMILGLIPPSRGELRVLGDEPGTDNSRIGYVPQDYTSAVGEAVRATDAVRLGLTGRRWGLARTTPAELAEVDRALADVGATDFACQRVAHLSGGQRQRVAIAQAIVSGPQLLALDEPLANLDLASQQDIVRLVRDLNRTRGMTVLVVCHDLNPLLPILTSVIYLLDGHAHYDSVDGAVNTDLLSHLYGTGVKVARTAQGDLFMRSTL